MKYGPQIGVIVYGHGLNARAYAEDFIRRGFLVIYRDGHAAVYRRTP